MIFFVGTIIFIAMVFIVFVFSTIPCNEPKRGDEYWHVEQGNNNLDPNDIYYTTGDPRW